MRKGQKQTDEARAKISQGMRGRPKDQATKEKMSNARTIYWARERRKRQYEKEVVREREEALAEMAKPLIADTPKSEFR